MFFSLAIGRLWTRFPLKGKKLGRARWGTRPFLRRAELCGIPHDQTGPEDQDTNRWNKADRGNQNQQHFTSQIPLDLFWTYPGSLQTIMRLPDLKWIQQIIFRCQIKLPHAFLGRLDGTPVNVAISTGLLSNTELCHMFSRHNVK